MLKLQRVVTAEVDYRNIPAKFLVGPIWLPPERFACRSRKILKCSGWPGTKSKNALCPTWTAKLGNSFCGPPISKILGSFVVRKLTMKKLTSKPAANSS